MALTRKFLTALGIEADKVDEIISGHTESVNALKEDIAKYKADAEKLPSVQKELDELKEEQKKAGENNDSYKAEYDKLKAEFDDYKKQQDAKETKQAKEKAYRELLKKASISEKRIDTIVKASADTIDKIEFDKDGKVKDEENFTKAIDAEWADFKQIKTEQGANVSNPPSNDAGEAKPKSRAAELEGKYHSNLYGSGDGATESK